MPFDEKSLSYLMANHVSRQWRTFLIAVSSELFRNADTEDALAFLREVGSHMASLMPLAKVDTLEALEAAINEQWAAIDWGWVSLVATENEVLVKHGASPSFIAQAAGSDWTRSCAAILEGIYTNWFQAQGSQAGLKAVCIAAPLNAPLEFRYGR